MFIGAHEAEYMFVTTLLKIEQHLLAQGRCPYKLFREILSDFDANGFARPNIHLQFACRSQGGMDRFKR